jgi:DNA-binding XRE family transcriptional regulator
VTSVDPSDAWLVRSVDRPSDDAIGAIVREYRLASDLSQVVVARSMGMTQQYLSQIEKGSRRVSLEHRRRFAQVLGIPPVDLGLADSVRPAVSVDEAAAVAASHGRWRAQRHWLNKHRSELAKCAVQLYPAEHRLAGTPLIARPDWIPGEPVDLDEVELTLDEDQRDWLINGREPETLATRPLRSSAEAFDCYTAAVRHLDPPRLFESRPSYRYVGGSIAESHMQFGLAAYFDKLDVSEALGHEMVVACARTLPATTAELEGRLPFRDLISDPFDPQRRAIVPAITTLTIRLRRYPAEPSFLLHWRDPSKVATAAGVYDVIPAGEFQPSTVALWDRMNDFSVWRNMVREYSEELLGTPEHDGTRTEPIDYHAWPLYQELERARARGTVTASFLGMGLDALTLAATVLTVVVIDDDTFGRAFGSTVRFNDEGEIVAVGNGQSADGVPFNKGSVERMLTSEPMASPGAAALALAWKHRDALVG